MTRFRIGAGRHALYAFAVVLLTFQIGCGPSAGLECPECPGGVHACDECPTCPGGKHVNIGVPVPGPIIDTTGGSGGSLTHRYDEIAVTGSSGDTAEIDNRFIDTIVSAFLVDTTTSKLYGLTKNDVVTVTFSDGTSYTVKIGDTTQALEWTCSNVGTSTNVTLVSGSAGKLPNCVTTTGSKTVASVTTSTGKSGSMLVVRTND